MGEDDRAEMSEAHLRMYAHSPGRGSHPLQGVGVASPLDRQCNREAGVPSIMQAMLDQVRADAR
jgi:hypothetical protein